MSHEINKFKDNLSSLKLIQSPLYFSTYLNKHSLTQINTEKTCLSLIDQTSASVTSINTLLNPQIFEIQSISHAASTLQQQLKNWVLIPYIKHRKSALITEKLAKISFKKIHFGSLPPKSPIGHWCLLDDNHMLYSTACTAHVPQGIYEFEENKHDSPSRAYLKLWELFTRLELTPDPYSTCIDLGAAPGGWTWVLSQTSKKVISIDKSPLEIYPSKKVFFIKEDILKLSWEKYIRDAQWIFCDAALSPDKIVPLFIQVLKNYPEINFVCTLKQKGNDLSSWTHTAASIKGTRVLALSKNKHELTWIKINNNFIRL